MAKTPSPNVIAAKWILEALDPDNNEEGLEADSLAQLSESRVSEEKAEKVRLQIDKITSKLVDRCNGIINRFFGTPKKRSGKPDDRRVKKNVKHKKLARKHREEEE